MQIGQSTREASRSTAPQPPPGRVPAPSAAELVPEAPSLAAELRSSALLFGMALLGTVGVAGAAQALVHVLA